MENNVKSIAEADKNVPAIETWLAQIAQQRVVRKQANVQFTHPMPTMAELSQVFRDIEENKLRKQHGVILKHSLLNLSLEDYVDVCAALLGIPVYADDEQNNDKARTHAVYLMFNLYMQFVNRAVN